MSTRRPRHGAWLAKEEDDFAKDAELLRAAIRDQPEAFRDAVEARVQQVLAASHQVTLAEN